MKYIVDHDYHIHSVLSSCCHDTSQTTDAIFQYGLKNNFKKICLTNHFWDDSVHACSDWYKKQNYDHLTEALPLPQNEKMRFCFGAETDMDKNFTLGVTKERFNDFDFVVIPTTHLHMKGFTIDESDSSLEGRALLWEQRLEKLLTYDLPWHKIGIAHLTCAHICRRENLCETLKLISEEKMYDLFKICAEKGVGIELNFNSFDIAEDEKPVILKPYIIAKDCGCKFYMGSDSHSVNSLNCAKDNFENIVKLLDLSESDKFEF